MRTNFLLVLTLFALGCGAAEVTNETDDVETAEDDLTSTATLKFLTGQAPALDKALTAGKRVAIVYEPDRLYTCRGEANGKPAWSITGYWQLNGGEVKSFEAGGFSPSGGTQKPEFVVPAAGELAMWFQITNRWGCSAWDSNYGQNFRFQVQQAGAKTAKVTFKKDYSVAVTNSPTAGKPLVVDYALSRLPNCRQTYNGMATWEIQMSYRYDSGKVQTANVTAVKGMDRVKAPVTLSVPAGARQVEMWFHNSDRAGCSQWDSMFGQNYKVALR